MSAIEILIIGVVLAIDALSASVTCGIKTRKREVAKFLKIAFSFGFFQAGMTLLGVGLGHFIGPFVESFGHWISFAVFFVLGLKTIKEGLDAHNALHLLATKGCMGVCSNKCLATLSIATSIDAFLIGILFALSSVNLYLATLWIGIITFILSLLGTFWGTLLYRLLGKYAFFLAGLILVALAAKSFF